MTTTQTTSAPNLMELLTRPSEFFAALRGLPASTGRYVWVVLLSGMLSAAYGLLSQRPVQQALSGIPGGLGGAFGMVTAAISALVVSFIIWLLLWGLGSLGAGREGRPAEVFAATFLPSIVVSLILLPLSALFPLHLNLAPPNFGGLEGQELGRAIQKYSLAVQNEVRGQPMAILGQWLSYAAFAWQFYLAWVGFGVLTGDRSKAMRGALIPLVVLLLLGGALWLLGRAAQAALGGGA